MVAERRGEDRSQLARLDEAIEQLRRAIDLDPNFARAHWYLGLLYEQKGMYREAIAEMQEGLGLSAGEPSTLGSLGHAYAISGNRAPAQKTLAELRELSTARYVAAHDIAVVHAGLGAKRQSLDWLEKGLEDRSFWMLYLKVDPRFDGLRGEPRFQNLIRRMGLPP